MKNKFSNKEKAVITAIYLFNLLFYVNYRLAYALLIHLPVYDFKLFVDAQSSKEILYTLIFDALLICLLIFGWLWTLIIAGSLLTLNSIIFVIFLIWKRWKMKRV